MAKVLNFNFKDTPVTGGTTVELTLPQLNYGADFRVTKDAAGEAIIANIAAPIDMPERFRFAHNSIVDVYRNTGIDPTMYYASRRGTQILCQLTDVYSVTDDQAPEYQALLPVEAHIVVKVPNNELITAEMAEQLITRMLAGLYETTSPRHTRLSAMLRGALLPAAL